MALCKIKEFKIIVAAALCFVCVSTASILFALGGVFYAEEHWKVLNYASSTCTVRLKNWQAYRCVLYFIQYACYVTKWSVYYGNTSTEAATIDGTKLHKSLSNCFDEAEEYRVSIQ